MLPHAVDGAKGSAATRLFCVLLQGLGDFSRSFIGIVSMLCDQSRLCGSGGLLFPHVLVLASTKLGGKPELEPVPGHQPCWWLLRDEPIPWLWSDLCDLLCGSSEELLLWAVTRLGPAS